MIDYCTGFLLNVMRNGKLRGGR